jgi:psiF repeat
MMTISSRVAATAFASLLLCATPVLAQSTTAPAAKSDTAAPAATDKKASKPHTAASIECSKEADAKGLHGKERKKFRSDCKKQAASQAK